MNADRPDPRRNGARGVRTDGHDPAAAPADPERRLATRVSRLDRVTLQLGVAVAVVIALCSLSVAGFPVNRGVRVGAASSLKAGGADRVWVKTERPQPSEDERS